MTQMYNSTADFNEGNSAHEMDNQKEKKSGRKKGEWGWVLQRSNWPPPFFPLFSRPPFMANLYASRFCPQGIKLVASIMSRDRSVLAPGQNWRDQWKRSDEARSRKAPKEAEAVSADACGPKKEKEKIMTSALRHRIDDA
jgi:hypothetical protein